MARKYKPSVFTSTPSLSQRMVSIALPVQSPDRKVQHGGEAHPRQIRSEQHPGQRRSPPKQDHRGGNACPEQKHFRKGKAGVLKAKEDAGPQHVQD